MTQSLKNTVISGGVVGLDPDRIVIFGPGLVLEDCDFISDENAGGMGFRGMEMKGGRFVQTGKLKDFQFERVRFSGVSFSGDFLGCDFGNWDEPAAGAVADCDFSNATMHHCRFINCDVDSIRFPAWPCFVIRDPAKARDAVNSGSWPRTLGRALDIYSDVDPECVAAVGNAEVLAAGDGLSLDEVLELLTNVPGFMKT